MSSKIQLETRKMKIIMIVIVLKAIKMRDQKKKNG